MGSHKFTIITVYRNVHFSPLAQQANACQGRLILDVPRQQLKILHLYFLETEKTHESHQDCGLRQYFNRVCGRGFYRGSTQHTS
jgi:hypothetical protein